jgi:hypothetical protein
MIRILKKKRFDSVNFKRQPKVLQTPQPEVFCKTTDSAIEMAVRPGQPAKIMVLFSLNENCKTAFDAAE